MVQFILKEVYPVKGEDICIESDVLICTQCGETVYDDILDEENLECASNKYRDLNNLLGPRKIKSLRKKYGLSQRGLSSLLK